MARGLWAESPLERGQNADPDCCREQQSGRYTAPSQGAKEIVPNLSLRTRLRKADPALAYVGIKSDRNKNLPSREGIQRVAFSEAVRGVSHAKPRSERNRAEPLVHGYIAIRLEFKHETPHLCQVPPGRGREAAGG